MSFTVWMHRDLAAAHSSRRGRARARRLNRRPRVELLEDRRLLSSGRPLFDAPWQSYATALWPDAFGPISVAVGDLDADGDADVVVASDHFWNPGVTVLLNRGDGSYAPGTLYELGRQRSAGEVVLADVDFDGDLDVLAAVQGDSGRLNQIALWRNAGDGTLGARSEFEAGPGPFGLLLADFTGDGFPDAVTADYGSGHGLTTTVSLLPHNGLKGAAAGFLAPRSFTVGQFPRLLAAGDLNGDGWTDLAVGRGSVGSLPFPAVLTVLLNDGAGGFRAPTDYTGTQSTAAVALADVDRDGDLDLLGAGRRPIPGGTAGTVTVRLNAGDGTFGPSTAYTLPDWAPSPQRLAVADLDADGNLDMIGSTPSDGGALDGWGALRGDGAGGFLPSAHHEAGQVVAAAATADADGDGDLDVLTVAHSSAVLTVHKNPGSGAFPALPRYGIGSITGWTDAADIDLDGDLDIVGSNGQVHVLRNRGDGAFALATVYIPPRNFGDVKLRDLNGDGYPDLLMGPHPNHPPYHFGTALNNGDGTFAPGTVWLVGSCGDGTIDAFDLDNDGDLDVALTEEASCAGGRPNRIFLYRNDGAGAFTAVPPIILSSLPFGLAGGDLNNDGNIDLVTGGSVQGIWVHLGNGDLTFRPELISGPRPSLYTLADVNLDGILDVAMIPFLGEPFGTDRIGVSLGRGDGTFAEAVTVTGSSRLMVSGAGMSGDVDVADVDGDGLPDLVITNVGSNDVSVFLGNGDGTVRLYQRYGLGQRARNSVVADFTGDGVLDVASQIRLPANGLDTAIVVLPGLDTGFLRRGKDLVSSRRATGTSQSDAGGRSGREDGHGVCQSGRNVHRQEQPDPLRLQADPGRS